jgi:hypothetical protein
LAVIFFVERRLSIADRIPDLLEHGVKHFFPGGGMQ